MLRADVLMAETVFAVDPDRMVPAAIWHAESCDFVFLSTPRRGRRECGEGAVKAQPTSLKN
jgi:hypothetical protein